MFERIVAFSLRNRTAVVAASLVVALWGWSAFRSLTVEAFPDPTDRPEYYIDFDETGPYVKEVGDSECAT